MHGNISFMFDYLTMPVVHLLLLKSSMIWCSQLPIVHRVCSWTELASFRYYSILHFHSQVCNYQVSVTRLGEILPLWIFFSLWQLLVFGYLVFGKILNLLWQIFRAFGQIFMAVNGQTLNSLVIWSHWLSLFSTIFILCLSFSPLRSPLKFRFLKLCCDGVFSEM